MYIYSEKWYWQLDFGWKFTIISLLHFVMTFSLKWLSVKWSVIYLCVRGTEFDIDVHDVSIGFNCRYYFLFFILLTRYGFSLTQNLQNNHIIQWESNRYKCIYSAPLLFNFFLNKKIYTTISAYYVFHLKKNIFVLYNLPTYSFLRKHNSPKR